MTDIPKYGSGNGYFSLNLGRIRNWGKTDPPFTLAPIREKRTLELGFGNSATQSENEVVGYNLTIHVKAGSPDSARLKGILDSGVPIQFSHTYLGTGEVSFLDGGIATTMGEMGRNGTSPSDDSFSYAFVDGEIKTGSV